MALPAAVTFRVKRQEQRKRGAAAAAAAAAELDNATRQNQFGSAVFTNKPAVQTAWQTLPDATPPVGKIDQFSKIAVTFEPIQQFRCPSIFRISEKMSI